MSWRDRLLPASFRGQSFHVLSDTRTGGRRVVTHEYPLRDQPYAEDLGRQARTFEVDGILVGGGYDLALRGLIRALEQSGPGLLIHPSYGLQTVLCVDFSVELSTADGGTARVRMEFGEAGRSLFDSKIIDTLERVLDQAATVYGYVQTGLAAALWLTGVPSLVTNAAGGLLGGLWTDLQRVGESARLAPADLAAWSRDLARAQREVVTTAAAPALTAAAVVKQISTIASGAGTAWTGYRALRPMADWGRTLPAVPRTTRARVIQAANQDALVAAVRDLAVAHSAVLALRALAAAGDGPAVARLAVGIPANAEELRALKLELLDLIEARAAVADDALYQAWADLRAKVARDLEGRALAAPHRRTLVPVQSEPALVLAYRLYGDAGRADEIVRRNHLAHPGQCPGGVALEVVSS